MPPLAVAVALGCEPAAAPVGSWQALSAEPLMARGQHVAAWTGREMLIWGGHGCGRVDDCAASEGGRYDPASRTWRRMSGTMEPLTRVAFASAWSGRHLFVWGGLSLRVTGDVGDGGLYDVETDQWTTVASEGAPAARRDATAVWTGAEVLLWGGRNAAVGGVVRDFDDGAALDPVTNTWRPIAGGGPSPRAGHAAVWAETGMFIWGGAESKGGRLLGDGAIYDPLANQWRAVAPGGPPPRWMHFALWTGREVLVWGGRGCGNGGDVADCLDGAAYDPATNRWRALPKGPTGGAHAGREVWTGQFAVVLETEGAGGWLYEPSTDRWTSMAPPVPGFAPRSAFSAVWTGKEVVVWGGLRGHHHFPVEDGATYAP